MLMISILGWSARIWVFATASWAHALVSPATKAWLANVLSVRLIAMEEVRVGLKEYWLRGLVALILNLGMR